MNSVGVVIATFGSQDWFEKGYNLKEYTLQTNSPDQIVHIHGPSLAEARNLGWKSLSTDYVIFLDADDRLDKDYISMLKSYIEPGNIIYQPETIGWYGENKFDEKSNFIQDVGISLSNFLVVGSPVTREFCIEFDPILEALEDWDFFLRMISTGAKVKKCPGMIYQVGINEGSRNDPNGNHMLAYQIIHNKKIQVSNYMLEN